MEMLMNAMFYRGDDQNRCDYVNTGAALACGSIVNLGNDGIGIVTSPEGIAVGSTTPQLGSLAKAGVFRMKKTSYLGVVFFQGDNVYWDSSAGTSVRVPNANTVFAGIADEDAAHGHTDVKVDINKLANTFIVGSLVTTTSTTTTPAPTTTTTT